MIPTAANATKSHRIGAERIALDTANQARIVAQSISVLNLRPCPRRLLIFQAALQRSAFPSDMDEQGHFRSSPRPQATHFVTIHIEGKDSVEAYTRDVSNGGLFVFTSHPFVMGDRIEVSLSSPSTWEPLRLKAEICRVVEEEPGRGIGLRFVDMTDKQLASLLHLTNSLGYES
jgi:uncharacterized protein (TIGR02266 family)